jgi:hypothetical protein
LVRQIEFGLCAQLYKAYAYASQTNESPAGAFKTVHKITPSGTATIGRSTAMLRLHAEVSRTGSKNGPRSHYVIDWMKVRIFFIRCESTCPGGTTVAHRILVIAYHILRDGTVFQDEGRFSYDRANPERTKQQLLKRLEMLGWEVEVRPAGQAADGSHH